MCGYGFRRRTCAEALVCLRVEAPGAGPGCGDLKAAQHPGAALWSQRGGEGEHRVYGHRESGVEEHYS